MLVTQKFWSLAPLAGGNKLEKTDPRNEHCPGDSPLSLVCNLETSFFFFKKKKLNQELKAARRIKMWLSITPEFLKQTEAEALLIFPMEHGGYTSHKDASPDEGVPEERFDFTDGPSMIGATWRFQSRIANTSQPLFLLKSDGQCEKLIVVSDILLCTNS